MSQLFSLSAEQLERIKPFLPRSHGIPRVDDRKVISGIIYVIKHGLQWKDAPREYGPYKTIYNRFLRWSRKRPCSYDKDLYKQRHKIFGHVWQDQGLVEKSHAL